VQGCLLFGTCLVRCGRGSGGRGSGGRGSGSGVPVIQARTKEKSPSYRTGPALSGAGGASGGASGLVLSHSALTGALRLRSERSGEAIPRRYGKTPCR